MVLARVQRVRGRGVDVGVLVVYGQDGEGCVCGDEWQAVIRREDVRATEKDKVVCAEGFRVGDVVRGVVVCLLFLSLFYISYFEVCCICMHGRLCCGRYKEKRAYANGFTVWIDQSGGPE